MATELHKHTYEAYGRVWDSRTPDWKQLLAQILDDSCTYSNMVVSGRGLENLSRVIESFHSTNPESTFAMTGYMEQHGKSLGYWDLLDSSGRVVLTGANFTAYGQNGRIIQISGFWES